MFPSEKIVAFHLAISKAVKDLAADPRGLTLSESCGAMILLSEFQIDFASDMGKIFSPGEKVDAPNT